MCWARIPRPTLPVPAIARIPWTSQCTIIFRIADLRRSDETIFLHKADAKFFFIGLAVAALISAMFGRYGGAIYDDTAGEIFSPARSRPRAPAGAVEDRSPVPSRPSYLPTRAYQLLAAAGHRRAARPSCLLAGGIAPGTASGGDACSRCCARDRVSSKSRSGISYRAAASESSLSP